MAALDALFEAPAMTDEALAVAEAVRKKSSSSVSRRFEHNSYKLTGCH